MNIIVKTIRKLGNLQEYVPLVNNLAIPECKLTIIKLGQSILHAKYTP